MRNGKVKFAFYYIINAYLTSYRIEVLVAVSEYCIRLDASDVIDHKLGILPAPLTEEVLVVKGDGCESVAKHSLADDGITDVLIRLINGEDALVYHELNVGVSAYCSYLVDSRIGCILGRIYRYAEKLRTGKARNRIFKGGNGISVGYRSGGDRNGDLGLLNLIGAYISTLIVGVNNLPTEAVLTRLGILRSDRKESNVLCGYAAREVCLAVVNEPILYINKVYCLLLYLDGKRRGPCHRSVRVEHEVSVKLISARITYGCVRCVREGPIAQLTLGKLDVAERVAVGCRYLAYFGIIYLFICSVNYSVSDKGKRQVNIPTCKLISGLWSRRGGNKLVRPHYHLGIYNLSVGNKVHAIFYVVMHNELTTRILKDYLFSADRRRGIPAHYHILGQLDSVNAEQTVVYNGNTVNLYIFIVCRYRIKVVGIYAILSK